jgi:hypothetical protein
MSSWRVGFVKPTDARLSIINLNPEMQRFSFFTTELQRKQRRVSEGFVVVLPKRRRITHNE